MFLKKIFALLETFSMSAKQDGVKYPNILPWDEIGQKSELVFWSQVS